MVSFQEGRCFFCLLTQQRKIVSMSKNQHTDKDSYSHQKKQQNHVGSSQLVVVALFITDLDKHTECECKVLHFLVSSHHIIIIAPVCTNATGDISSRVHLLLLTPAKLTRSKLSFATCSNKFHLNWWLLLLKVQVIYILMDMPRGRWLLLRS